MLKRTNSIILLLCVFLILPYPALTATNPTRVTCYPQVHRTDQAFQNDCRALIQKHVIGSQGPLAGSSGWNEDKMPGSQISIWSISSKSCTISFSVPRPCPGSTWTSIQADIKAIAADCVNRESVGGSRGEFCDPSRGIQPKYPLVWITQTSQYITRKEMCRAVRFRTVSSMTPVERAMQMACWKMYGAAVFAAAGGFALPVNPGLATGFYLNGARIGFQSAAEFRRAVRQQYLPGNAATRFLRRSSRNCFPRHRGIKKLDKIESDGVARPPMKLLHYRSLPQSPRSAALQRRSPAPLHPRSSRNPLSQTQAKRQLHPRSMCTDVFALNPSWLTREQHQMRIACLKMFAGSAAIFAGGYVGSDTKAGKSLVGGGAALSAHGMFQYGQAKVHETVRGVATSLFPPSHSWR